MAVISCPNCEGKLRFPDDMPPRRVKCPACGQSFMGSVKGPVSDSGTSSKTIRKPEPPKPAASPEGPASDFAFEEEPTPPKRRRDEDDDDRPRNKRRVEEEEDEDDRPRKRRREEEEDEEVERPRSKKRRGEDEEDDRPRGRGRRDDDEDDDRPRRRRRDEEDEDDRPRSRRRARDDEADDDYDDRRKPIGDTKAQYANARTGIGLAGIGFWCQVGALGIILLFVFLGLIAQEDVAELRIPAGLAGLAAWILGAIGFSFLIAGPRKGNLLGLTIALVAVTAIHLFMVIYIGFASDTGGYRYYGRSSSSVQWEAMPTSLTRLVFMIIDEIFVTAVLIASIFEIARFVLFTLVLKEYAKLTKNRELGGNASLLLIGQPVVLGISFVLFFILHLIYKNTKGPASEFRYIMFLMLLLEYGGYIAVYVLSALACLKAKSSLYKRK